jgi:hypothetical protein
MQGFFVASALLRREVHLIWPLSIRLQHEGLTIRIKLVCHRPLSLPDQIARPRQQHTPADNSQLRLIFTCSQLLFTCSQLCESTTKVQFLWINSCHIGNLGVATTPAPGTRPRRNYRCPGVAKEEPSPNPEATYPAVPVQSSPARIPRRANVSSGCSPVPAVCP